MKSKPKLLNDLTKFQIAMFGKFGGYSHKGIASMVWGGSVEDVPPKQRRAVSYWLRHEQIRLSSWRDALSPQARQYARAQVNTKARRKARVRVSRRLLRAS